MKKEINIKKTPLIAITFAIAVLFMAQKAHAQGTLYLSNTSGTPISSSSINSTAWVSQGFETGANIQGYSLDEVDLQMAAATGTPSGFSVAVFSAANGVPSASLGVLSGSANPATSGLYAYTASGITLNADTDYFIVASAANAAANGSFEWNYSGDLSGDSDWQGGSRLGTVDGGDDWLSYRYDAQTVIYATAVPEPPVLALLSLSGIVFVLAMKRKIRPSQST